MKAATNSTACFRVAQGADAVVQSLVSFPREDTNKVVMLAPEAAEGRGEARTKPMTKGIRGSMEE